MKHFLNTLPSIPTGLLLAGIVLLTISGCASTPTREQFDAADFGLKPSQQFAEDAGQTWLHARLKDPNSAKITWRPLEKAWFRSGFSTPTRYAWRLVGSVNAKNSFGGYTGAKPWVFFFRGNKMVGLAESYSGSMIYVETDNVDWGNE